MESGDLDVWREVFGPYLAVEVQMHGAGRSEAALAGALIALAERSGGKLNGGSAAGSRPEIA